MAMLQLQVAKNSIVFVQAMCDVDCVCLVRTSSALLPPW